MKKRLKASHEFFYDGKTHKAGDEFDAVDPDANILVVMGKATLAPVNKTEAAPLPPAAPPKLETADLKPIATDMPENREKRRRYARRDLTAEES